ncbi:hypothetical protein [Pseudokineococcus sp. 1T1Z-3]|uniref:hypothetical protein n=1 Tax=Pseudokineococcus sp. 1T1Z-3 TaxID=3132745 RepID=UPI0030B14BFD
MPRGPAEGDLPDLLEAGREDEVLRNDVATTAVVLGVLSLVLSVLAGVPALVAGVAGLVRSRRAGTGAVRSAVAVLLGVASVVVALLVVRAVAPYWQTAQEVGRVPVDDLLVSGSPVARAGAQEAVDVLAEVGVDAGELDCAAPVLGLEVVVGCTAPVEALAAAGTAGDAARPGSPVEVRGTCPVAVLAGEAVCELRVGEQRHDVVVALRDGVPEARLLP